MEHRRPLAVVMDNFRHTVGLPKTTKDLSMYTPKNPYPPLGWKYSCGNCGLFEEPDKCALVSEQGGSDPGEIRPEGWCIFWVNRPEEPILSRWLFLLGGLPPMEDPR